ncbi:MAG: AsnC family transcriptional regulator [Candidatus Aenigmarchaeota archaeon]|nr:AsnC family transcriptional regulator [Candidatus Aenigmarchaeota archaeon]
MMTDKLDMKILHELDMNARQSVKRMAKNLRKNRDVVAYRIKQMEKSGIIAGYYSVIDFSKLGYMLVRVYVKLCNVSPAKEKEILGYLKRAGFTFWVAKTEGEWDIVIGCISGNFREFERDWEDFERLYRKNIHEKDIAVFSAFVHFTKDYLACGKHGIRKPIVTGTGKKTKLDRMDLKLLNEISSNAKISLLELSGKLGMTSMAARYRIKRLERMGVILGYRPVISNEKLGIKYYKLDMELEDIRVKEKLRQFVSSIPNVIYEDRTIGGSDFEFDLETFSHEEFMEILNKIRSMFPGKIRTYKYYLTTKIHKILYIPKKISK